MTVKLKNCSGSGYESAKPLDHKNETALSIFADLSEILESSEKQDFEFLSYLLRMAALEAQSIASERGDGINLHPANHKNQH